MGQITNLQKEIHRVLEEYKSLEIVNKHLKDISQSINIASKELTELDKKVDKELNDVEELESKGLQSMFYNILGSKEEQLEKERQEYLELALKFNELKKKIELMEFEKGVLEKKAKQLPNLKIQLAQLKAQRSNEILNSNEVNLIEAYNQLIEKSDHNRLYKKELEEAHKVGGTALEHLHAVNKFLSKALNWGQWDMRSKKNVSTHMKHNAIDKANQSLTRAQYDLDLYSKELGDLNITDVSFQLNIEHFTRFTDYFFDNLITDWIIQQKIKNSKSNVERNIDAVMRIQSKLKKEYETIEEEFKKINASIDQFLLN